MLNTVINAVRFPGYKIRKRYLFSTLVRFFSLNIILPSKFWYQNTHKIKTEGLWEPKFSFYTLWGSQGIRRANSTCSVLWCSFFLTKYYFTLKILVPKYSPNKYGGLMEAEILNICFVIKMPQAVQLDLKPKIYEVFQPSWRVFTKWSIGLLANEKPSRCKQTSLPRVLLWVVHWLVAILPSSCNVAQNITKFL